MSTKINPFVAFGLNLLLNKLGQNSEPQSQESGLPEVGDLPAVKRLYGKDGAVILILGRIETGKTILAQRLAELLNRPTYAISPEQDPPSWIRKMDPEEIGEKPPPMTTLICDDMPEWASQKDYRDSYVQKLERIIPVVRHKRKIMLIFIAQSSGLVDKFVAMSNLIFMKPVDLLFEDVERAAVARIYKRVMPIFSEMSEKEQQRVAYCLSTDWRGLVRINKPSLPN